VSWKRAPRLARFSSTYPYLHATRLRQKSRLTGGSHVPVVLRVREYSLVHSGGSRRAQSGFTVPSYLLTHTGSRVSRSDGWGRNRGDIYLAFAASMATAASTSAAAVLASRFLRRSPRLLRCLGLSSRASPAAPSSFRCPALLVGTQQLGRRARMGHSTAAAAAAPALGLTKPNAVELPQVCELPRWFLLVLCFSRRGFVCFKHQYLASI
jgi:hypothetical protein